MADYFAVPPPLAKGPFDFLIDVRDPRSLFLSACKVFPRSSGDRFRRLDGRFPAPRHRTVKLRDHNDLWTELEKDPNPFALVVMAHLKTKATRGKARERLAWKVELVRQLYERGDEPEEILELFRFIDWLLVLPDEMTKSFRARIQDFEQEPKMKYVTSIERLGRQEGQLEVILALFEEKFGPPDSPTRSRFENADREQVLRWAKRILTASSQDEVFAS